MEMKDATFEVGGWQHAFLGRDDFAVTGQPELPDINTDPQGLKQRLLEAFSGRDIEYRHLLNEAYPDPRFHMWVERHFRLALVELVISRRVQKIPVSTKRVNALSDRDRLVFP